jgi:hypothetical protein
MSDELPAENLLLDEEKWRIQSALADKLAEAGTLTAADVSPTLWPLYDADEWELREAAIRYGQKLLSDRAFRHREMEGAR